MQADVAAAAAAADPNSHVRVDFFWSKKKQKKT